MGNRLVRMGIDVGGTHTKAVAIDNATHEIIGKSSVKTTQDDRYGVAAGVVKAFQNCLRENDLPSGGQHLAGHTGKGVVRKAFVQYTVGYEVAQLIRMPFRNRFGGIELVHGILLLYRS